jgi:hypothetical protein
MSEKILKYLKEIESTCQIFIEDRAHLERRRNRTWMVLTNILGLVKLAIREIEAEKKEMEKELAGQAEE